VVLLVLAEHEGSLTQRQTREKIMRLMLRFTIPVEKGNEAEADGSMSQAIKELIAQLKPEAAYFHLDDGKRAGTIFYEEDNAARLAVANEPFFAKLNASIDIQPAVSLEELMSAL
jgi:hypothetical protein